MELIRNACIYCRESLPLEEFISGDHIILRSLGGQKKLKKTDVCHKCNGIMGKTERRFIYDSHIAVFKQIYGPSGRRGNFKTKAHFLTSKLNEPPVLGYIEQEVIPKIITQIRVMSGNNWEFHADPGDGTQNPDDLLKIFIEKLKERSVDKAIFIEDDDCLPESAYICIYDDKLLIFINSETEKKIASDFFLIINQKFDLSKKGETLTEGKVSSHQRIKFDLDDYKRVVIKMVLNCICEFFGKEFVLQKEFDQISNFALTGKNPSNFDYLSIIPKERGSILYDSFKNQFNLSEKCHFIIAGNFHKEKTWIGYLSLYGGGIDHLVRIEKEIRFPSSETPMRVFVNEFGSKVEYEVFDRLFNQIRKVNGR